MTAPALAPLLTMSESELTDYTYPDGQLCHATISQRFAAELDAQRRARFKDQRHIEQLMADALELYKERNALRDSLNWLVHLAHGIGMAGGSPQSGECESAIEAAEPLLRADLRKDQR